ALEAGVVEVRDQHLPGLQAASGWEVGRYECEPIRVQIAVGRDSRDLEGQERLDEFGPGPGGAPGGQQDQGGPDRDERDGSRAGRRRRRNGTTVAADGVR